MRTLSSCFNRTLAFVLGFCVMSAIFAGTAHAQPPLNKKTILTFNQPIEIPGVGRQVLPAGSYVFKLIDSTTERHIVQILSKDEKHLYATVLAIPNYRLKVTDHTTIVFAERPAGAPAAIRAWFKGGDNWGQEFVYPKARAMEIAKETNQSVLFVPNEMAADIAESTPAPVPTESPVGTKLKAAPIMAYQPSGEEVAMSQEVEAPPVQMAAAETPAKLPKTAGNLELIGLLGIVSLCAGLTLRGLCAR